jgi:hypothetical protein
MHHFIDAKINLKTQLHDYKQKIVNNQEMVLGYILKLFSLIVKLLYSYQAVHLYRANSIIITLRVIC